MKRSWIIAGVVAIAAVGWILSGQIAPEGGGPAEPDRSDAAPAAEAPRPRVRVVISTAEPVTNELILQARTLAKRRVQLRAEISGTIEEILVDRGIRVESGQPLVRLSVDERAARLAEAQALLAQRQVEFVAAEELNRRGYRADTQLAESQAALDSARAGLRLAEVALENTMIHAPFDGIVADRAVEIGDFVDIGNSIATVMDFDPLRIIAQVSERHLGRIAVGGPGSARLVDGRTVEGLVSFVAAETNPATRTFAVEIEVSNPDGRLIEGVSAELHLPYADSLADRLAPSVLTLSDEGEIGVKSVVDDDRVVFYPVEIIAGSRDAVWLDGLPERLRVIVVGQDYVRAGDMVEPVLTTQLAEGGGTP